LHYLERTCELQLKAMSSGRPLKIISDEMAEATCKEIEAVCREQSISHMEAICRMLIADDPRLVE
jgi:TusA-related sulfurtransferase